MTPIRIIAIVSLLGAATCLPLRAQQGAKQPNPQYTILPFLTITPDSRGSGMGEIGVATRPDINSMHWNPAKYGFMNGPGGVALSHTPWLRQYAEDVSLSYLAGYYSLNGRQKLAGSIRYFSFGKVDFTDAVGNLTQQYKPHEFAADLSYIQKFPEYFSIALALRYIRSDLGAGWYDGVDVLPISAVATDVGFYFTSPLVLGDRDASLSAGAHLSNIGLSVTNIRGKAPLPTNLRLGANFDYAIDRSSTLSVAAEANALMASTSGDGSTPAGNEDAKRGITWGGGLEYSYNQLLFARGGYFYEHPSRGNRKLATVGVGAAYQGFRFDFAYLIPTEREHPLGRTLRLTVSYYF